MAKKPGLSIALITSTREEVLLLQPRMSPEETRRAMAPDQSYSPRQYSFRDSAVLTAKVLGIAGALLAVIWMLDVLVTA
jgi:hypothetical protein